MSSTTAQSNVELVESLYAAFAEGDMEATMAGWTEDIEWVAVEGGPYGGTYTGSQAIAEHVFQPLAEDWSEFALVNKQFIDAGDTVVVTGIIDAIAAASGTAVEAAFAHVLTIENGGVTRFVEYADTHPMQQAL
ncbi:nuclear transport factor 2 family protein [Halomarina litorea]|uniref:nuclear transport factor 2 family protein n=1 Tax=Halomarina litorea TaxID=2961595 RepID=UPI0020C4246C|nr:nuclear transport factor 2 family protein [Halomarina sp. BCD28]